MNQYSTIVSKQQGLPSFVVRQKLGKHRSQLASQNKSLSSVTCSEGNEHYRKCATRTYAFVRLAHKPGSCGAPLLPTTITSVKKTRSPDALCPEALSPRSKRVMLSGWEHLYQQALVSQSVTAPAFTSWNPARFVAPSLRSSDCGAPQKCLQIWPHQTFTPRDVLLHFPTSANVLVFACERRVPLFSISVLPTTSDSLKVSFANFLQDHPHFMGGLKTIGWLWLGAGDLKGKGLQEMGKTAVIHRAVTPPTGVFRVSSGSHEDPLGGCCLHLVSDEWAQIRRIGFKIWYIATWYFPVRIPEERLHKMCERHWNKKKIRSHCSGVP